MTPLIQAKDVSVTLGGRSILHGISMSVVPGEIVTIVGPNGSGKTTLLRALTGAVDVTKGTVTRRDDLRIGYAPQRLALDSTMPVTVDRFLSLMGKTTKAERRAALADVDIESLETAQLASLSGGQFQRALLARAILRKPNLLALDEPTQGLDQPGTVGFYRLIERVREQTGCGVLMVSHDLHVVMSASDRVLCVNGHICCEGTPTVVSEAPEYRAMFGSGTAGALALYQHHHDHSHTEA
jgi:zinc transport system ATP-binding protein